MRRCGWWTRWVNNFYYRYFDEAWELGCYLPPRKIKASEQPPEMLFHDSVSNLRYTLDPAATEKVVTHANWLEQELAFLSWSIPLMRNRIYDSQGRPVLGWRRWAARLGVRF